METTIYIDVLFLLNFFVTYLLLKATARIMSIHIIKWRILIGSLLGGIYSMLILFDLNSIELAAIKIFMGLSLLFVVFFNKKEWRRFIKTALCFFFVNFIFAGFLMAVWLFVPVQGMQYKNGVAYFDISALTLALSTTAAYLLITLFTYILNKRAGINELFELTLTLDGRQVSLIAFADTGNKLSDIFSGLPVIVCEFEAVNDLFPEKVRGFFKNPTEFSFEGMETSSFRTMFRVIPVCMAAGAGTLPAFKPDNAQINGVSCETVIAVTRQKLSDGSFQAILNPVLL